MLKFVKKGKLKSSVKGVTFKSSSSTSEVNDPSKNKSKSSKTKNVKITSVKHKGDLSDTANLSFEDGLTIPEKSRKVSDDGYDFKLNEDFDFNSSNLNDEDPRKSSTDSSDVAG